MYETEWLKAADDHFEHGILPLMAVQNNGKVKLILDFRELNSAVNYEFIQSSLGYPPPNPKANTTKKDEKWKTSQNKAEKSIKGSHLTI